MVTLHPIKVTNTKASWRAQGTIGWENLSTLAVCGTHSPSLCGSQEGLYLSPRPPHSHIIFSSYFGFNSLTEGSHYTGFFSSLNNELREHPGKIRVHNAPEGFPRTSPPRLAGTSQRLPLQEMYIIKIECCSMNFIHTCLLGLFVRNNYLCLLSREHIFYRVH